MNNEDLTVIAAIMAVGAATGALTAFGLSFINLSPLVMGGIIGAALPALITVYYMCHLASELFREGEINDDGYKGKLFRCSCLTAASAAVGMGIVAAASAYGVTTGTVLAGAAIGALSPIIGFLATEKVNEYIISPVVEKVKGCFSSPEREEDWRSYT